MAGIDIAPTVLRWLHRPIPSAMKGQPIRLTGSRDVQALQRLSNRLKVVDGRRFPVLETVLGGWLLLTLALGVLFDRRGTRRALRIGGLALLWLPGLLLATAALQPSQRRRGRLSRPRGVRRSARSPTCSCAGRARRWSRAW